MTGEEDDLLVLRFFPQSTVFFAFAQKLAQILQLGKAFAQLVQLRNQFFNLNCRILMRIHFCFFRIPFCILLLQRRFLLVKLFALALRLMNYSFSQKPVFLIL